MQNGSIHRPEREEKAKQRLHERPSSNHILKQLAEPATGRYIPEGLEVFRRP
jgi:chorismate mutase